MDNFKLNKNLEILTPTGYRNFHGIRKLTKDVCFEIKFNNNKRLKCSETHIFISDNKEIKANELTVKSSIDGKNGESVIVTGIEKIQETIDLYDIVEVDNGNVFIVDDIVSHNCDFSTSGNQVVHIDLLEFQKQTYIKDPIEKRGVDQELWIWERPDYSKNYILMADCARGDGADFSSFHVFDTENVEQVAEYKGKMTTKDYGNFLVTIATEYNNALLVVENNNIGWATIQQIIDRGYDNLFYREMDLNIVEVDKQFTNKLNKLDKKAVPGFTTTSRNRPLMISKMETYFREKSIIMHSIRLYDELAVFIWNGSKAEAMKGYNDDLVMSLAVGLWIRDTALKLRSDQMVYNKKMIEGISKTTDIQSSTPYQADQFADHNKNWKFNTGKDGNSEDLKWLL
jgi:hypothetical protein